MSGATIYQASNGEFYGDVDVWEYLETERWRSVCWDDQTGQEWVETESGDLVILEPIPTRISPAWIDFEYRDCGITVTSSLASSASVR